MGNLAQSIPPSAQDLLKAMRECKQETEWYRTDNGEIAYLHPMGRVLWKGVVNDANNPNWSGHAPLYLINYWHPKCKPGCADAHWFVLDILEVVATEVKPSFPSAKPS